MYMANILASETIGKYITTKHCRFFSIVDLGMMSRLVLSSYMPYTIVNWLSTSYLMQTIGMAIQRGNSSCILETVLDSKKLDGVYCL